MFLIFFSPFQFLGAVQLDVCIISRSSEGLLTVSVRVVSARNLGEKEELESLYPYVVLFNFFFFFFSPKIIFFHDVI